MAPVRRAVAAVFSLLVGQEALAQSTDGGRGDLPGMKRDMFDAHKKRGQQKFAKVVECPKSDGWSPFQGMFQKGEKIYVKFNESDEQCHSLVSVAGVNITSLYNASRTCGSAGEFKRRVAENLSAVMFIVGSDSWPKAEGDMIEIETEDGNFTVPVNEANLQLMLGCWSRGCGCPEAAAPKTRIVLVVLLLLMMSGLFWDSFKMAGENLGSKDKKSRKDKKEKKDKSDKKDKKEKKEKKGKKDDDTSDADSKSGKESSKDDAASNKTDEEDEDGDSKKDQ